jgi:2-haloacid dehalogenase
VAGIEAVVFDIGNVLIGWEPEQFYDKVIGVERRTSLFAEVPLHEMNERVDLGADFAQSVRSLASQHADWKAEILLWHDRWLEMAQPEIEHSSKLLRALRAKKFPVFALSNFGVGSLEIAKKAYPVLTEFDRAYVSGHMEVMKPDPEIYQRLEDDSGISPGGLLFADDRLDNIEAANARGWGTHHFVEPQGFADRLVAEKLLTELEAAA